MCDHDNVKNGHGLTKIKDQSKVIKVAVNGIWIISYHIIQISNSKLVFILVGPQLWSHKKTNKNKLVPRVFCSSLNDNDYLVTKLYHTDKRNDLLGSKDKFYLGAKQLQDCG